MNGEDYLQEGYAYLYEQNFYRAEQSFLQAILCDPSNPEYYFHASVTMHRNQAYQKALQLAQISVELAPDCELYAQNLQEIVASILVQNAYRALSNGNKLQAAKDFAEACLRDPFNVEAFHGYEYLQHLLRRES
ncbi:hypothetical protein ACOJUR_09475 [Alicyclobacillus tolerans]|uniref:Tetratricopeptide (TPR) repeat protein n=2 Tax=Alicyclobacillus tolerans TaxID=90970 RepID=A0ABT9LV72_9BACL|nr:MULTISPECIES: hypothetical protein [Alicyclobacillus]MDP9728154.1 tetratricopeptide (TPR) repeat protein [Alicyclobacillus tengchongensis]QRF23378.1 hypothetical protein FY534_06645 [Alicyclobacillus sp. TC]SHJ85123.1 hypothetical protein SAMN05443507_104128 [Alicyclobacillus montanus]